MRQMHAREVHVLQLCERVGVGQKHLPLHLDLLSKLCCSRGLTVPSGDGKFSFWYQMHCPDTVTYDWATITLKDNTTGTTTTMLGKTCTNTGTWVQASASVIGGHSYTLTLLSHDDNYPGDPTYTLFDDAVVS
jgi:hypothetical protein